MTDLRAETERLLALADAATKNWSFIKSPRPEHQCFVESPPANGMPRGLEVFGDDYTGYGDDEQRAKDLEFAAAAHAMAAHIRTLQAALDAAEERTEKLLMAAKRARLAIAGAGVNDPTFNEDWQELDAAIDAAMERGA